MSRSQRVFPRKNQLIECSTACAKWEEQENTDVVHHQNSKNLFTNQLPLYNVYKYCSTIDTRSYLNNIAGYNQFHTIKTQNYTPYRCIPGLVAKLDN